MPTIDLLTVFTSYIIRPILENCCVVWHFSLTLHQENQLERIQKRALRTILAGGTSLINMLSALVTWYHSKYSLLTRPHDSGYFPPQTAAEMSLDTRGERATE